MKETPPSQNEKDSQTEAPATPSAAQASNSYLNSVNASQATSSSVVGLSIVPVKVKVKGSSKKGLTRASIFGFRLKHVILHGRSQKTLH